MCLAPVVWKRRDARYVDAQEKGTLNAPVKAALAKRAVDVADAEPAVPGWRLAVDALFA